MYSSNVHNLTFLGLFTILYYLRFYLADELVGTLVISCSTTFENAKVFNPVVLDADKAIRVWNAIHEGKVITDGQHIVHARSTY